MTTIITRAPIATKRRTQLDQYELEVNCGACKKIHTLWFSSRYKVSCHKCPITGVVKLLPIHPEKKYNYKLRDKKNGI